MSRDNMGMNITLITNNEELKNYSGLDFWDHIVQRGPYDFAIPDETGKLRGVHAITISTDDRKATIFSKEDITDFMKLCTLEDNPFLAGNIVLMKMDENHFIPSQFKQLSFEELIQMVRADNSIKLPEVSPVLYDRFDKMTKEVKTSHDQKQDRLADKYMSMAESSGDVNKSIKTDIGR